MMTTGSNPIHTIAAAAANQDAKVLSLVPCLITSIQLCNVATTNRFVKLYNKATAPTSADTPVKVLLAPAGGGNNPPLNANLALSAGLAIRITTGMADSDTGTVTAGDVAAEFDLQ